ncbi:MAG: RluA family pseudouridine synthase [Spirochaetales bacterium]|nr:RluA family pseudouridine synthase [Spirochaetales bacterium]
MGRYSGRVELDSPLRLDRYVAERLGILTRSQFKSRLESALVDGKAAKPSALLSGGETLELAWTDESDRSFEPEDIPLDVVFENGSALVVDKAQGMVVHPAAGNWSGTLANALLGRLARAGLPVPPRAGIVHRLDKDTSGLVVAAKDERALEYLAAQFRERTARKDYLAVLQGRLPAAEGLVENRLGRDPRNRKRFAVVAPADGEAGRFSSTRWKVLAERRAGGETFTLVALRLRTGRTHQLRVHMRHLGCPILGDPIYGKPSARFPKATLMLHARRLRLSFAPGEEPRTIVSMLPARFVEVLGGLGLALPREDERGF